MTAMVQPDLPTGRLSFTQVDTYLSCPKKYEFRYITKPKMISVGVPLKLGSALHEIIAMMLNAKIKNTRVNTTKLVEDSRKRLNDEFDKVNEETVAHGLGIGVNKETREIALDQHDRLFKQWCIDILPEFAPTAVEKEYMITIGGYPFVIYIDAIHADKRVVDWKVTGSPKNKYVVDSSLQLSIYSIAAEVDEVAFGSLIKPKEGKERTWKPSTSLVVGRRTKAEKAWAVEVIKTTAQSIRSRNFPLCSPENFLCSVKYCDFYPMCRGKELEPVRPAPRWMDAIV